MAAEYAERIGGRIKEAREAAGLTQRELAERLPGKADGTQLSRWERGVNRPGDATLEHIAKITGHDVSWFLLPKPDKSKTPNPFAVIEGAAEPEEDLAGLLRLQAERLDALTQAVDALRDEIRLQANEQEERAEGVVERIAQVQQRVEDLLQPRRARPA